VTDLVRGHFELARERRFTYEPAAELFRIKPVVLVKLAESRAGAGPVRNIDLRDLVQDTREEYADARNYLVWIRAQLDRGAHLNLHIVDELRAEVSTALGHTAFVFERAERIRHLMNDWRPLLDIAA
jgi:hypothetical protein